MSDCYEQQSEKFKFSDRILNNKFPDRPEQSLYMICGVDEVKST